MGLNATTFNPKYAAFFNSTSSTRFGYISAMIEPMNVVPIAMPMLLPNLISYAAAILLLMSLTHASPVRAENDETLCVMSFNLWQGGEEGKQPLVQSIKVIEAANADAVGLQEIRG
jgi:hypothetical protein